MAGVTGILQTFSPEIEPSADEPGVFWMNASGLDGLFPSRRSWAEALRDALARSNLRAAVAVGFSKFGTYAATALSGGIQVFETPLQERETALRAPLRNLRLPDEAHAVLSKLGVLTVEALLRLPRDELLSRFGREVHQLHRFAAGDCWTPLQFRPDRDPARVTLILDAPDENAERLLFLIKGRLPALLSCLAERGEALAALEVQLKPEGQSGRHETVIRPAAPTMDEVLLMELLRLKLQSAPLPGRVEEIALLARGMPWVTDSFCLFPEHPQRDLAAGRHALARVRAALGDGAVVRARLKEGHLPEAHFAWEPVDRIPLPKASSAGSLVLVRRIWERPQPLSAEPRMNPDGQGAISGLSHQAAGRLSGPYIVSGAWWRKEVHRDYYFAQTPHGDVLWIYYDRVRRHWFVQGRVE
jgi:protein ImuB